MVIDLNASLTDTQIIPNKMFLKPKRLAERNEGLGEIRAATKCKALVIILVERFFRKALCFEVK